ncbi:tRNA(Met)-cytidine N(4)-acetyltransferase [Franzmannia pantelleriensis]|uniref:tRNA(Met) cytidine acetyltransferase TmcA n=1 Tax=Franzmannia pantelleriensis TaxID=48727 RepID=A0A1G9SVG0_9GAMM|nr:GNAT family N-acetyltransferase [Halomonas pantelleriensis]SDM38815.1 tRNA(Met)-cytidine N(4)-acetyltransferase [Halomonas pantelleriensis]
MSDASAVQTLQGWRERLAKQRWRGLLWVTAGPEAGLARALAIWHQMPERALWVAPQRPAEVDESAWLPTGKARTRLGGEQALIVFDAVSAEAGFDPDAFGALSGTLIAGGLLVLLTPPGWGAHPDADYRRLADHPHRPAHLSSRYLQRLARLLEDAPDVAGWRASGELVLPTLTAPNEHAAGSCKDPACATLDQARAVARLLRLRRRRPLVISADRGRGKSAALGIACARWLASGEREILVTAPRPAAVETLFEHLQRNCPDGRRHGLEVILQGSDHTQRVRFVAPDALAEQGGGAGSLLLVDEAAAIPSALLADWLARFPRIAFATTVHGYEGSGRGFALRFLPHLQRRTPDWRSCTLAAPVRWADGDPLEALTRRLLLLDAEPRAALPAPGGEPPVLRRWKRSLLAVDEARLSEMFGLLVQAHYRTQPSDLRRLLDGPGVSITTLERHSSTLAVSLCCEEGSFSSELAERVARGERRPRGHLLAQSLAAHAGSRHALTSRVRRIMRIAVHADARRQGHGQRLLAAEVERAHRDGIDLLGASFGADPELMAFWHAAGFRAVRLGLSHETSTGEHALMVALPASESGRALCASLAERFQRLLPTLLAFELNGLAPAVAVALLAEGQAPPLSAEQCRDLDDVTLGRRELALVRPALQQLVRRGLAGGAPHDSDAWLLVAWLFQARSSAWLAERLGLAGRREVQARLREALTRWRDWAR